MGDSDIVVSGDSFVKSFYLSLKCRLLFQSELFQRQKLKYVFGTKVIRVSGEKSQDSCSLSSLEIQQELSAC